MKALIVLLATGTVMLAQTPPPTKSAAPAAKPAAPVAKAPAVNPLLHPETLKAKAPDSFKVKFTTTHGDFVVEVHRDWSPLGADRFYNLVKNRFFTNAAFFRIVPNFIVQFGMAPDPKVGAAWENATIKDDPMKATVHNTKGTLAVSYTHLDVYKRQGLSWSCAVGGAWRFRCFFPVSSTECPWPVAGHQR